MPNVTTKQAYDRRNAVYASWLKGIRSIPKLAELHKADYHTIKRDLVFMRKYQRAKLKEETLNLIKIDEDNALLQDIAQIEELIEAIRGSRPEKQKGIVEAGKIVEGQVEKGYIEYGSIVSLIDRKLKLRHMRRELWGFVSSHKGGVQVAVSAQASAGVRTGDDLGRVSESDLRKVISISESIGGESCSGSKARISS